ncbi:MAG: hypothetical protein K8I02_10000, partial [Candidatus Methylomirabilis sp.]|nr:hypothetical protein [Deltaproteobacteria bacterium]
MRRAAFWGVLLAFLVPGPARAATELEFAYHWAPILFQDTAQQGSNISPDFISRVDFDGDFRANNNWNNQPNFPHPAYVYYDLIETETYWFLAYSFFHPRDWEQICLPGICHENDMEQMRAIIQKDGSEFGALRVVDLQAHGDIHSYVPGGSPVGSGTESIDGTLSFEGTHPRLYLEAHGHGPQNCDSRCTSFPGGDGVVYRPHGVAEVPPTPDEPDIGYALLSGYSELWTRRKQIGDDLLWKNAFVYQGARLGTVGRCIGGELTGDDYGGAGVPPWGYDGDQVNPGDFWIDAAYTAAVWYAMPGEGDAAFFNYVDNPYLGDLIAEGTGACEDPGGGCAVAASPDPGGRGPAML